MKFNHILFDKVTINYDKKRIPLSATERKERKGSYRYYGAQGVIDYVDDYIFDGTYLLIAEDGENLKSKKKNVAQMVEGKLWVNNHAHIVQTNELCNLEYLYYLINSIDLSGHITGSAQPKLSQANLNSLELILPDRESQDKVVSILKTLDSKIANNKEINDNLAEQIRTLCDSWLSNYEPFGGTCPDDWEHTPLSSFAKFISGYSYKGAELQESNTAMATIKNFDRKGGFKLDGYKEIIPSSKLKSEHHVELFDTLVAHTDLTQNAEVIGNAEPVLSFSGYGDIIFSMDVVKVIPVNPAISKFLIAAMLQTRQFKGHCLGYVNGTTVLHLSKKALLEYSLMLPKDLSILAPLDEAVSSMYRQMALNIDENVQLANLRDSLLPQLMSGELDVSGLNL